jgi:hypothetical protein
MEELSVETALEGSKLTSLMRYVKANSTRSRSTKKVGSEVEEEDEPENDMHSG